MMAARQTTSAAVPANGGYLVTGSGGGGYGNVTALIWAATARDQSSTAPNVSHQSERTAKDCFMRGLKENMTVYTSDGIPWLWRRIVFCQRGNPELFGATYIPALETFAGIQRVMVNISSALAADVSAFSRLRALAFKGEESKDWANIIAAPVDRSRLTIMSDVTTTISSGNANGIYRKYKRWYPMNKTLVYGEDESGDANTNTALSTTANLGMGDCYVLDLFQPGVGATGSNVLTFEPSSTLYWHER